MGISQWKFTKRKLKSRMHRQRTRPLDARRLFLLLAVPRKGADVLLAVAGDASTERARLVPLALPLALRTTADSSAAAAARGARWARAAAAGLSTAFTVAFALRAAAERLGPEERCLAAGAAATTGVLALASEGFSGGAMAPPLLPLDEPFAAGCGGAWGGIAARVAV